MNVKATDSGSIRLQKKRKDHQIKYVLVGVEPASSRRITHRKKNTSESNNEPIS